MIAYTIAGFVYCSIGIMGSIGISGRESEEDIYKKSSIVEFFESGDVTFYHIVYYY